MRLNGGERGRKKSSGQIALKALGRSEMDALTSSLAEGVLFWPRETGWSEETSNLSAVPRRSISLKAADRAFGVARHLLLDGGI